MASWPSPRRRAAHGGWRAKTVWGTTPSPNGIEDAIHYEGRFYSITYSGQVEVWEQRADAAGAFTSMVVAPRLLLPANLDHRRYLVAALGGRLMVVLKESEETTGRQTCSFKVQVLDASREGWKETDDIGETALFVGGNSSLCVSTRKHPELRVGCVYYYIEDDLGPSEDAGNDDNGVWVLSLKDGSREKIEGLGQHRSLPWPVWFTPSTPC